MEIAKQNGNNILRIKTTSIPIINSRNTNALALRILVFIVPFILFCWTWKGIFNLGNNNFSLVKSSVFHFVCGAVPLDWNSKDTRWVVDILMLTCEPAILNVRVITNILFTFIWVKIFGEKRVNTRHYFQTVISLETNDEIGRCVRGMGEACST